MISKQKLVQPKNSNLSVKKLTERIIFKQDSGSQMDGHSTMPINAKWVAKTDLKSLQSAIQSCATPESENSRQRVGFVIQADDVTHVTVEESDAAFLCSANSNSVS